MAAYGALVSLMHTMEQIQKHPLLPISLDKLHVESQINNLTLLQNFLTDYSHGSIKGVGSRIAAAANAAEDVIESHIAKLYRGSTSDHGERIMSSPEFYQCLNKAIDDMELIRKEVLEIEVETKPVQLDHVRSTPGSSRQGITVGLDDVLNEIMAKLIGEPPNRVIIAIAGMAGIGKTTLARNVYVDSRVNEYFDFSAWVTVSAEYNVKQIFLEILLRLNSGGALSQLNEDELGQKMFRILWGRRYIIVLDDMWSIDVWEKINLFFPDNNNGSRILVTTRLYNVAFQVTNVSSSILKMNFLDVEKSWNLFCKNVFGDEDCPLELEEIGMEIARNCKGLPLSIVVIGGLLAQSRKSWEYIVENLSSVVNLEDDERCLKILHTSYNQLPVHLKPCFLYMGIYPQKQVIRVSLLIKLWVAEGFLKPISGKSLEEAAEEYLHDLIDRNLIMVRKLASDGKTKFCRIHDLIRDLCLREAHYENFICERRCIGFRESILKEENLPQFASLYRLVVVNAATVAPTAPQSGQLLLLRLMRAVGKPSYAEQEMESTCSEETFHELVNLRYLAVRPNLPICSMFPSSVSLLWNLQTLIVHCSNLFAPAEIWMMPQLRHVMFGVLDLPDPPTGQNDVVLENLQTLLRINNFKCGEEVVKRIPNVKKLKVYYEAFEGVVSPNYYLNNLVHLHQLESLCSFTSGDIRNYLLQNLAFPRSLKKLTLEATFLHSEDIGLMVGPLPFLQVLKLRFCALAGPEWETVEEQFCSLRFLLIDTCLDFESWITESSHFPRLEHLVLRDLEKFKEIPLCIGDIPTLQSIELDRCSDSAVVSAKEIVDEQEGFGNEGIRVRVKLWKKDEELESLASPNFQVSR